MPDKQDVDAKKLTNKPEAGEDPREAQSTEERILAAAEKEFLKKGFAGARTTAIAEAAGVNHAMLHYYYRTKEKLFSKVLADKMSDLAGMVLLEIDKDMPLTICIRRAVGNHFDYVRAHPELPRFVLTEVMANPELLDRFKEHSHEVAEKTISALQKKLDACAARGECRKVNAMSLMLDIISLNVFPILGMPILSNILASIPTIRPDYFLDLRREENIRTILKKLEP